MSKAYRKLIKIMIYLATPKKLKPSCNKIRDSLAPYLIKFFKSFMFHNQDSRHQIG